MLVTKRICTEYNDPATRLLVGAMLITWPLLDSDTVDGTGVSVEVYSATFGETTVLEFSCWLYSIWMMVFSGTLVALGNGLTVCTTAGVFASDPAVVNDPENDDR